MSITVNIYYSGENGAARRFAQEMLVSGTVEQCRQEKGNLKYEFFYLKKLHFQKQRMYRDSSDFGMKIKKEEKTGL